MKTVLEKTLSRACTALLLSFAAAGAPACGATLDPGTGETHFLATCSGSCGGGFECLCGVCTKRCDGNGDVCQALASGATCETCEGKGVCDHVCTEAADCASLGASFTCTGGRCRQSSAAALSARCPAGYEPVVGRPVNDCVEVLPDPVPAEWVVGCLAPGLEPDQMVTKCYRRVSDGSAWLVSFWLPNGGRLDPGGEAPGAWEDCTESQQTASFTGCNFAGCENPPPSSCTLVATCDKQRCGGAELDENGCARPSCTTDDECSAEQRCTHIACSTSWSCTGDSNGECSCMSLAACFARETCMEVASVGQRGEWTLLEVTHTNYECGDEPRCTSWYRIGANGGVAAVRDGQPISSALLPENLAELRALIDGPLLRPALRDGDDCGVDVQDASVVMRLTLSTGTLERDVSGCALMNDGTNIFKEVDQVASRY